MTNQTQNKDVILKYFILHNDSLSILKNLTDEEAGKLFKAMADYQNHKILPNDRLILLLLQPFLNQFSRDEEKYKNVVERNKNNIAKRWNKLDTKNTTGIIGIPNLTKNTNNNSNSKNNSNSNIDLPSIESEVTNNTNTTNNTDNTNIVIVENKQKRFVKPSIEEIKEYCLERNNNVDANKFFNYYQSNGWKVGKVAMKDWQACIRTWEKNNYSNNTNQGTTTRFLTTQETKQQADKDQIDRLLKNRGLK